MGGRSSKIVMWISDQKSSADLATYDGKYGVDYQGYIYECRDNVYTKTPSGMIRSYLASDLIYRCIIGYRETQVYYYIVTSTNVNYIFTAGKCKRVPMFPSRVINHEAIFSNGERWMV